MRILRVRRGFQADHSSSSYLFYAVDHPVSAEGRAVARRYSSRAEVHDRTVRYQKWGESDLNSHAYKALLGAHYDVMVSESYDWWTLMIALPKTPQTQALLAPFTEARGYDDQGVEVEDYGKRLVVVIYCAFEGNGVEFAGYDEDALETLVDLLVKVRAELIGGDTSFLEAVVSFYGGDESDGMRPTVNVSHPRRQPHRRLEQRRVAARMRGPRDRLPQVMDEGPAPRRLDRNSANFSRCQAQGREFALSCRAEVVGQLERT